jgi:hypothetical protein
MFRSFAVQLINAPASAERTLGNQDEWRQKVKPLEIRNGETKPRGFIFDKTTKKWINEVFRQRFEGMKELPQSHSLAMAAPDDGFSGHPGDYRSLWQPAPNALP